MTIYLNGTQPKLEETQCSNCKHLEYGEFENYCKHFLVQSGTEGVNASYESVNVHDARNQCKGRSWYPSRIYRFKQKLITLFN